MDGVRHEGEAHHRRGGSAALSLAALGIVFGALGTSPLYALDQLMFHTGVEEAAHDVPGALCLVVWTITLIAALKYAILMLRAENDGEGGVFALYGLVHPYKRRGARGLLWALMLGAGLLFADGMLTPAISVLAAVEGLEVAAPQLAGAVIPVTLALLGLVFAELFIAAAQIGPMQPFVDQIADPSRSDLIYLSYITLTTVGFGDLTPRSGVARTLIITEALIGQIFLVTAVARVVSLFGSNQTKASSGEDLGG